MMRKRVCGMVLLIGLLLLPGGCSPVREEPQEAEAPAASNPFSFSILKVGQADAIIMQTAEHCVVIDCGEADDGGEVVEYLTRHGIGAVDYLFLTHFDKDHVGGAAEVIGQMQIGRIVTPDYEGEGDEYESYLEALNRSGLQPQVLTENDAFVLDDVLFEVFPPQRKAYAEDDNDFSLAISVTHGDNRFLFTGDAESVRLSEIMQQTDREYDFLKVPHHGKYNATTKKFLERVKPVYGVICDSEKNPAEKRTLDALAAVGCEVYCTKDGDILVESDGTSLTVTQ